MSLPLTRRIARAALLIAAGAAPVVGAAASANAAGLEPVTQPLGAVSALDGAEALGTTDAVGTDALAGGDNGVMGSVGKVTETTDKLPVGTPLGGLPVGSLTS
ncbi:ATP-binding protein [Streptomyces bambusae]|uniref:ATP-binding protein n=1 Tax=Streptomyces bambusae TaxID=1550616 RepID=A0ABS6Z959_9ACTN|nr:ATP-binding protein [Streptomyces bambusae]MBW5484298.1 ATP-binding protein [Streptomyces bambusae]